MEPRNTSTDRIESENREIIVGPTLCKTKSDRSKYVYTATLGFADGITVPFSLMAGLSVLNSRHVIIVGGLAEVFAGALSMGLGQFMTTLLKREQYKAREAQEKSRISADYNDQKTRIHELLGIYGICSHTTACVLADLQTDPDRYLQFIMDTDLKETRTTYRDAALEGIVMALAYALGGLLPAIPYFTIKSSVQSALFASVGVTVILLLAVGFSQTIALHLSYRRAILHASRVVLIGAAAAGTSYGLIRAINQGEGAL